LKCLYLPLYQETLMRFLYLFLLLFLIGCSEEKDSVVTGGEFSVHFDNQEDYDLAKKIVTFWKKEGLMTGKKQDVKLKRTKKGYDLMLISIKRKKMEELTFEEISSLTILRRNLQQEVFKDKQVDIVLTDESFKPLFRPSI